jgi:hypothetical protein
MRTPPLREVARGARAPIRGGRRGVRREVAGTEAAAEEGASDWAGRRRVPRAWRSRRCRFGRTGHNHRRRPLSPMSRGRGGLQGCRLPALGAARSGGRVGGRLRAASGGTSRGARPRHGYQARGHGHCCRPGERGVATTAAAMRPGLRTGKHAAACQGPAKNRSRGTRRRGVHRREVRT